LRGHMPGRPGVAGGIGNLQRYYNCFQLKASTARGRQGDWKGLACWGACWDRQMVYLNWFETRQEREVRPDRGNEAYLFLEVQLVAPGGKPGKERFQEFGNSENKRNNAGGPNSPRNPKLRTALRLEQRVLKGPLRRPLRPPRTALRSKEESPGSLRRVNHGGRMATLSTDPT
jgi:hypothetical protein